jgi:hypothetical protein
MPSCEACHHLQIYAAFAVSFFLEPFFSFDPSFFQNLAPEASLQSLFLDAYWGL